MMLDTQEANAPENVPPKGVFAYPGEVFARDATEFDSKPGVVIDYEAFDHAFRPFFDVMRASGKEGSDIFLGQSFLRQNNIALIPFALFPLTEESEQRFRDQTAPVAEFPELAQTLNDPENVLAFFESNGFLNPGIGDIARSFFLGNSEGDDVTS